MTLHQTSREEFGIACQEAFKAGKRLVPVCRTLFADTITPVQAYRALDGDDNPAALLESVIQGNHMGRYSIVACDPFFRFVSTGKKACAERLDDGTRLVQPESDPLELLQCFLKAFSPMKIPGLSCFTGGAVGYMGYESILLIETSVKRHEADDLQCPDIFMYFYRHVLVFDQAKQQLHIVVNVFLDHGNAYESALAELNALQERIYTPGVDEQSITIEEAPISSNMTKEEYLEMVKEAKKHIIAGDIFQIVLSQRFSRSFTGSTLDFYRVLRLTNPSPYMFHLNFGDGFTLVGASPEVMVRLTDGNMLIKPIAGTRRRGATDEDDAKLAAELLADEKEIAEHIMLVDLARNDVGRHCEYGSVKPRNVKTVEMYSHVMHIVSEVHGKLRYDVIPIEAIVGSLPAGTLSGAPKVEAMKLISRMEKGCRGPYGGAIGWFADTDSDTCIGIRCALVKDDVMYWQSGGGIVYDSVPEAEYEESLAKARAIRSALEIMEKGGLS